MSVECIEYSPNSLTWVSNLSYFHPLQGHSPPSHHQSNLLHTLSCPRPWFRPFPVSRQPLSPTHFCLTKLLFPSSSVQILPPPRSIFRSPGWNESPSPRPCQGLAPLLACFVVSLVSGLFSCVCPAGMYRAGIPALPSRFVVLSPSAEWGSVHLL